MPSGKAYKCGSCSRRFMSFTKRTMCVRCISSKKKWPGNFKEQHSKTVKGLNSKLKQHNIFV